MTVDVVPVVPVAEGEKMYIVDDLKKKTCDELREKIKTTEITKDVFSEIEEELHNLVFKQHMVKGQIDELVQQANDMCMLFKMIQCSANGIYSDLKAKELEDQGIDLSNEYNRYKHQLHISAPLTSGTFYKAELKKTMA